MKKQEKLKFVKMNGLGNDFVIVEKDDLEKHSIHINELAKKICDRNFGVGADGLVIMHPSKKSDFRMQIINSDGSEPEMCGNAIRCVALYLNIYNKTTKKSLNIETLAGEIKPKILNDNLVEVDMGEPVLEADKIPVKLNNLPKVINEKITIENKDFNISTVSMGNPHCIIFVDDLGSFDFNYWGPKLESSQLFPQKTNVEFVQVMNKNHLKVKVWERGAGPTLACGTGACAVLTAAVLNEKAEKKADVELPGGKLKIEWKADNRLLMTGPAKVSFVGEYLI